jgi:serine/threonine protein kinase
MQQAAPVIVRDDRRRSYELRELLDRGGEGTVWRTDHPDLLVKIRAEDPEVVRRDLRRVQHLPLQGLAVARPHAVVVGDCGAGFVMELERERWPLQQWLQVDTTDVLAWWRATGGTEGRLRVLGAAAGVVAQLHRRGVVVGDVSPRNLLVAGPSHPAPVVLIDPDGLHHAEEPPAGSPRFSAPHMAPEVYGGRAPHDARSDVFALALLIAHALLLEHPFRGSRVVSGSAEREAEALDGTLPWSYDRDDASNPPTTARILEDVVGDELSALLHRTFSAGRGHPGARPTAAAFAHALHRAADATLRCELCGDGGPRSTCVACGAALTPGLALQDPADSRRLLAIWSGVQRVLNRRLLTGALRDGNDPMLLVTGAGDRVRVESVGDLEVSVVQDGDEQRLVHEVPVKVLTDHAEVRSADSLLCVTVAAEPGL